MPPQFTFELFVTLVKFGEKPVVISKRTLDVYMSVVQHIAYSMAISYIKDGWRIYKIELLNYEYHTGGSEDGLHF